MYSWWDCIEEEKMDSKEINKWKYDIIKINYCNISRKGVQSDKKKNQFWYVWPEWMMKRKGIEQYRLLWYYELVP